MDVQLTDGAIKDLMSGNNVDKPVLQLLGIKKISANTERYRLVLSDGTNSCASFMLATQLNDKITNGELEPNTVIRVDKFVCNRIPPNGPTNKLVVIILEFSLVSNDPELERIGDPTSLELKSLSNNASSEPDSSAPKANASSAAHTRGNMSSNSNGREPAALSPFKKQNPSKSSFVRDPPAAASLATSSFAKETSSFRDTSRNSNQFINRNSSFVSKMFNRRQSVSNFLGNSNQIINRNSSFASNMSNQRQSVSQFAGKTHPIATLTPYQNRWAICARVIQKSSIRTWSNARGDGKLFSVTFLDTSGEIKATAFNAECEKFIDVLQEGKVFYVSNAQLKNTNRQFSNVSHDYEITFHKDTVVEACNDVDVNDLPQVQFKFVPINSLSNAVKDEIVDVLGVCKSSGDVQTFTSKANKEMKKRELQLVDKSNTEISLTLWGDDAEKFDGYEKPVIAVKGARVSEFGGRSLSLLSSSIMQVNPDFKESFALRSWFDNEADHSSIQSLSSKSGGGFSGPTEWKSLSQVEDDNMGGGDKADFFTCKAMVAMIRKEGVLYKACAQIGCNKKVVDNNGFYRCEKCNQEVTDFKWRLLLSMNLTDYSGNLWVTCFQEQAETILGQTAEFLGNLMQSGDEEQVQAIILEATFNSFIFKLRSKVETYNDENRIKTNVMTVSEVNRIEYGKMLIENLRK